MAVFLCTCINVVSLSEAMIISVINALFKFSRTLTYNVIFKLLNPIFLGVSVLNTYISWEPVEL